MNCASVLTDWSVYTNNNYCHEKKKLWRFHYVFSSRLTSVPCAWLYLKYSTNITINAEILWTSIWLLLRLLCPDIQELDQGQRFIDKEHKRRTNTAVTIVANCAIVKLADCACASERSAFCIQTFRLLLYMVSYCFSLTYCNAHTCSGQLHTPLYLSWHMPGLARIATRAGKLQIPWSDC